MQDEKFEILRSIDVRTQVGQYRIEGQLGRGGMGVVYRGLHEHLGRQVAVKALAPELTQQPEFKERFFAEAKTQARLQHPNIVAVYDLLEDGGEFFIVMEFVEGEGLDDLMRRSSGTGLDLEETIAIFSQVLAGLDYAHSEGVIHRDIKPSNVMVTPTGRVKLTDFGIALLIGDKRLTASQSAIGTPTYMSPEQILRPRSVDHRTDLYSAAVVLFEMLAGRPPFDDETDYGIKKQHVETPPPDLSQLHPTLPPTLVEAVTRALAKDPNDRYASAGLFLKAIQQAVPHLSRDVPTLPPAAVYRPTSIEPAGVGPARQPAPTATKAATGRASASVLDPSTERWQGLKANRRLLVLGSATLALALGFSTVLLLSRTANEPTDRAVGEQQHETQPEEPANVPSEAQPAASGTLLSENRNEDRSPIERPTTPEVRQEEQRPSSPSTAKLGQQTRHVDTPSGSTRERSAERTTLPVQQENHHESTSPEDLTTSGSTGTEVDEPSSEVTRETVRAPSTPNLARAQPILERIGSLSEELAETYDDEDRAPELDDPLETFESLVGETVRKCRLATGSGKLSGIRKPAAIENAKAEMPGRIGDLLDLGREIDQLMESSEPGPETVAAWKEIRELLRQLKNAS